MALTDLKLLPIRSGRRGSEASTVNSPQEKFLQAAARGRKRALTIPLAAPVKVGLGLRKRGVQQTHEQLQSLLFSKLPLEIRLTIWELILSGFRLHVFSWARKLGHLVCTTTNDAPLRLRQACLFPLNRRLSTGEHGTIFHRGPHAFLPLLKTCRRIYSETIDIIYSQNVFDFNSIAYSIDAFASQVLPQRWSMVRHVSLTWYFESHNHDPRKPTVCRRWDRSCAALASMTGLRNIVVGAITASSTIDKTYIFEILEPLESIKVDGIFDVYVSWEKDEKTEGAEQLFERNQTPFRLLHLPNRLAQYHRARVPLRLS